MEHMLWFVKNEIFQEAILVIGKTTEYNCQKRKIKFGNKITEMINCVTPPQ